MAGKMGKIMGEVFWTPGDGTPVDQVMTRKVNGMVLADALATLTNAIRRACAYVAYLDSEPLSPEREEATRIIEAGPPVAPVAPLPASFGLLGSPKVVTTMPLRASRRHVHPKEIVVDHTTRLPMDVDLGGAPVEPGDTYELTFVAPRAIGEYDFTLSAGWTRVEAHVETTRTLRGGYLNTTTRYVLRYIGPAAHRLWIKTVEAVADEALRAGEAVRILTEAERAERDRTEAMARLREVAAEARAHGVES